MSVKTAGTMTSAFSYALVPSAFGVLSIVWQETVDGPKVHRLFLPHKQMPAEKNVQASFPGARRRSCPVIEGLVERIHRFLAGKPIDFSLSIAALEECSEFQRGVLLAEHRIPRGWVSTYGRIAKSLAVPRGARAVGSALSHNPFPIIIPCHRALRSNGELGGFQGGLAMKRALLELEGVQFSPTGRVLTDRVYY